MLVELYHLGCDITEVDNYFSQDICMCFREKNIKGTLMAYFLLQSLEKKDLGKRLSSLVLCCLAQFPETFPLFLK